MIVRLKKTFEVTDIQTNKESAMVTCKIPRFSELRNYVQIGESITTEDHFDVNFGGFTSKWKLIFYPKGQYDFGTASNDCRLYIRLISCEKAEVKMKIRTYLISTTSSESPDRTRSSGSGESLFITNDNMRNWAGPFSMHLVEDDNNSIERLSIKCIFKLISNEVKDTKRALSETDSSPKDNQLPSLNLSKKYRSESPSVEDRDQSSSKQVCSPMEVDAAFKEPPDPFTTKSPLLYTRLTQQRASSENSARSAEKFVNFQRGQFHYKKPSPRRTLIYSPDERDGIRNSTLSCGLARSCDKMSLNQSNIPSKRRVQSNPFKSSGCVKVSDIGRAEETDQNNEQSGTTEENSETSTSDVIMLSDDGETNDQATLKEKIRYFENKF